MDLLKGLRCRADREQARRAPEAEGGGVAPGRGVLHARRSREELGEHV